MRFKFKVAIALLISSLVPMLIISKLDLDRLTTFAEVSASETSATNLQLKGQVIEQYMYWMKQITKDQANNKATKDTMRGLQISSFRLGKSKKEPDLAAMEERFNYQRENTPSMKDQSFDDWMSKLDRSGQLLQSYYVATNPHPIGEKQNLEAGKDGIYATMHKKHHAGYLNFLEEYNLYDVFLIEPQQGTIVYSVFKEMDFGTSLLTGPYADSSFGQAVKEIIDTNGAAPVTVVDFQPYAPSYDAQAAFILAPVMHQGALHGIFAIQLPLDFANATLQGVTDETSTTDTYLVDAAGALRSEPRLGDGISVGDTLDGAIAEQITSAASGTFDAVNYAGRHVIGAWEPLDIPGLNWSIVTEVDRNEAMAMADATRSQAIKIALGFLVALGVLGLLLSRWLIAPVQRLGKELQEKTEAAVSTLTETGQQARIATETMAAAADETHRQTEEIQQGSRETSSNVNEVAAAVEQLSSSIQEVVTGVVETSDLVGDATKRTKVASEALEELESAAERINGIIELIEGIAKQTNLLSLNAAIEASRAGEAGQGFAVVAQEIRKLAERTAASTADIGKEVEHVFETVGRNSDAVRAVSSLIDQMNAQAEKITDTASEQGRVTTTISDRMSMTATRVNESDVVLTQVRDASDDVARAAGDVLGGVQNVEHAAIAMESALSQFADRVRAL